MKFQNIVVMVAVVILIALLTWIGYGMYQHQSNAEFPPVSSECPDYWEAKDGKCVNVKHLGNYNTGPNDSTVDFNSPQFQGDDAICESLMGASLQSYGMELQMLELLYSKNADKNNAIYNYIIIYIYMNIDSTDDI